MCGDAGLLSPVEHCEAACLQTNLLTCRSPNNLTLLAKSSLTCRNIFFASVLHRHQIQVTNLELNHLGTGNRVFHLRQESEMLPYTIWHCDISTTAMLAYVMK